MLKFWEIDNVAVRESQIKRLNDLAKRDRESGSHSEPTYRSGKQEPATCWI